jgi:hypothetical protein
MMRMTFSMTTSNETEDKKATLGEHVADTHRNKPVVGQVVTGDIVSGEVTKNESDGDDN